MRSGKAVSLLVLLAFALLAVPVIGRADDAITKTILTFSQPVEIPGVVLAPGTYLFKFNDAKNTIQVLDPQENHMFATLLTTVTYIKEPLPKTTLTFDVRSSAAPQALKTIVPANRSIGHELIYFSAAGH